MNKVYLLWKCGYGEVPKELLGAYSTHDLAMKAEGNFAKNNPCQEDNTFITQIALDVMKVEVA